VEPGAIVRSDRNLERNLIGLFGFRKIGRTTPGLESVRSRIRADGNRVR
jgi:hypothetical protein